ncbi:reverse transcriptase domain-containing protein [Tanacetum coccineum]
MDGNNDYAHRRLIASEEHIMLLLTPSCDKANKKLSKVFKSPIFIKKLFGLMIILMSVLYVYTPYPPEPVCCSLVRTDDYQQLMLTMEHEIKFYVKSVDIMDRLYPFGTPERAHLDKIVIANYIPKLERDCDNEMRWGIIKQKRGYPETARETDVRVKTGDEVEEEAESSARGTVEIGVDRVTHPVVSDDLAEPVREDFP